MQTSVIVRIIVALLGVWLVGCNFSFYCKSKLSEQFAFGGGVLGVALVVVSAVPCLSGWSRLFSGEVYGVLLVLFLLALQLFFAMGKEISRLATRNQELAMQVSLLNCENAKILSVLRKLTGEDIMREHPLQKGSETDASKQE